MSKKKLLALLTASALTVGLLSGCGGGGGTTESPSGGGETTPVNTETEPGAASGGDIYVLVPNADHGWTGAVLNYAQEKAEEVNAEGSYNVVVQAATDAKNQQEQIDDLLAAATPPAGIVILPYDNTMESSMASIAATDIPFIMVDRIIDNPVVQEKVTANVKGDNEGIGKATAERFIADGLQPGDKLYVMIGDTSSVPEMRNKGFTETLAANGWSEEQLASIEYSAATGWSRSTGKQLFTDWINSKTVEELGEYHYIFTHDDEIGMGILEALSGTEIEQAKKDAFLASVDSIASSSGLGEMYEVLAGTHSNTAYPDIVANFDLFSVTYPPTMIQNAVDDMMSHLNGETVEKDHTITVDVVDSTNVVDHEKYHQDGQKDQNKIVFMPDFFGPCGRLVFLFHGLHLLSQFRTDRGGIGRQEHHTLLRDLAALQHSLHLSMVEHDTPVRHLLNFRNLQGVDDNGLPLLGQLLDELVNLRFGSHVDALGRIVQ